MATSPHTHVPLPPLCRGHDDPIDDEWSGGGSGPSESESLQMCGGATDEQVAACGLTTPDAWVWKSGDRSHLIPVTGAVPFNGEPPLRRLARHAVTPVALQYVRNHGIVPRIDVDAFRLQVRVGEADADSSASASASASAKDGGRSLASWSVDRLRSLASRTLLATLTCDGLRRKELNLLEHTKGFDTGPAATGNAFWTGVLLRDLLQASGVDVERELAAAADPSGGMGSHAFVCFDADAASEDLPFGVYATSLPLAYALNAANEVLIAYEHNGEPLRPDHGAPLRLVVPGMVGGRWIKWLSSITLSAHESTSEYHRNDNRAYPGSVSLVDINSGHMRGQPQWSLYELNVQAIITSPAHDDIEQMAINDDHMVPTHVSVGGFAFSGGGRRIIIVEVSADGGNNWTTAQLRYSDQDPEIAIDGDSHESQKGSGSGSNHQSSGEDPALQRCVAEWKRSRSRMSEQTNMLSARPKCWSWCWWSASIPVWSLMGSGSGSELVVRAFDEAHNSQPERLQWNAMGMLNNALYRVRVQQCTTNPDAPPAFRFLHPVLPGQQRGGWLQREATNGPSARPPHPTALAGLPINLAHVGPLIGMAAHKAHKLISLAEVGRHRRADDCWIVMDQQVFDVSAYMKAHPGGPHALLAAAHMSHGQVEALFRSIHAADAAEITGRFLIGVVASDALIDALTAAHGDSHTRRTPGRVKGATAPASSAKRFWNNFNVDEDGEPSMSAVPVEAVTDKDADATGERKEAAECKSGRKPSSGIGAAVSPRVNLPGSQDWLEPHRRQNWHEKPDPDRVHPLKGHTLFPRTAGGDRFLLHSTRWCNVELSSVRAISPDTKVFVFRSVDGSFTRLGLTTGQHLLLAAKIDQEWVVRPYTPIRPVSMEEDAETVRGDNREETEQTQTGGVAEFELLIKIYRPRGLLPGGRLTQHLDSLPVGCRSGLRVQGPTGFVLYEGAGRFNIHTVGVQVQRVNLIGGGTGITPLWQLMRAMLVLGGDEERRAAVQVALVFANSTPSDILLRDEIERIAQAESRRCRVCFVVSQPHQSDERAGSAKEQQQQATAEKKQQQTTDPDQSHPCSSTSSCPSSVCLSYGRINALLFRRHLHPPSSATLTFVCGPPPMVQAAYQHLFQLGFQDEQIVEF